MTDTQIDLAPVLTPIFDRLTAVEARLDALEHPTKPLIGVAPDTVSSSLAVQWLLVNKNFGSPLALRWYSPSIPARLPVPAPSPSVVLASFKSDPVPTATGAYDAQITAFAKTIPAGQYVTWQHEPEPVGKNITPAEFGAGWNHVYDLVKAQQPDCFMAPVVQTFAFNDRPDLKGTSPYVAACDPSKVDFVGLDAYSVAPSWRSLADEATPAATFVRSMLGKPDLPLVLGEFNQAKPNGRAGWLTDAAKWLLNPANKVALACLYDVTYGIGFMLSDTEEIAAFSALVAQANHA